MIHRQALSYCPQGILWLDEWDDPATDEEEIGEPGPVHSRPLGHINNPATGRGVPAGLHGQWDRLVEQWAMEVAAAPKRGYDGTAAASEQGD